MASIKPKIPLIRVITWKLRIKKNDKRYAGHPQFLFHLECPVTGDENFFKLRAWCWETWGPSKSWYDWQNAYSRNLFGDELCQNPYWCWIDDEQRHRLLFATKDEVALFKLSTGLG